MSRKPPTDSIWGGNMEEPYNIYIVWHATIQFLTNILFFFSLQTVAHVSVGYPCFLPLACHFSVSLHLFPCSVTPPVGGLSCIWNWKWLQDYWSQDSQSCGASSTRLCWLWKLRILSLASGLEIIGETVLATY